VNLVNPVTLRVNKPAVSHAKLQSSKWAERYEREHGKVYCQKRAENNAKRENGEFVKHEDEAAFRARVTQAYKESDSGKAFVAALKAHGYSLAQGRRLVVIDREGKPHSLFRQVEGINSADIKARLDGLTFLTLKDRSEEDSRTRAQRRQERKQTVPEYFDRDEQQRRSDERIIDAGIAYGTTERRRETGSDRTKANAPSLLNSLQDRHFAERAALSDRHHAQRHELDTRLDAQDGAAHRRLKAQVAGLEGKLNSGRSVFGRASKERELKNARLSLGSIEQRRGEAIGAHQRRVETERAVFEQRAADERHKLDLMLNPPKPSPVQERRAEAEQPSAASAAAVAPGTAHSPAPPVSSNRTFDEAVAAKEARHAAYLEQMSSASPEAEEIESPSLGED
jgi:hypothetical protein